MPESTTLPLEESTVSTKPQAVAKADKHIWGIFIALCIISVIELYSASSREVASSSLGVMGPILRHLCLILFLFSFSCLCPLKIL